MMRGRVSAFGPGAKLIGWSGRAGDIGLGAAVIAVVAMMVVPLTPWLVDLLISLNIAFSVLVLCLSLFIKQPLLFTSFPTLLLVATLYRLALNVSTTRLILLRADAGGIIKGFGGYIVGGDILVGAVIFGILAMVLFLVITKGAERVAEVAARFSLDALPGLQLAIDSDLRTGGISALEAARKRAALDQKSRYYGALDGAMKFVRGDAIAGLVITGVNIVGGLSVGMIRHGMTASRAIDTYGRLTVGDGLVTMIPALLISTAAGFLVTRVSGGAGDARLGEQVGRQFIAEPRAMGVAAAFLLALSTVRGLPAWPFLVLGAIFGAVAVWRLVREYRESMSQTTPDETADEWRSKESLAVIEMGGELFLELTPEVQKNGSWNSFSSSLADALNDALGIPIVRVPLVRSEAAEPREIALKIRGVIYKKQRIGSGEARLDRLEEMLGGWLRGRADRLIGLDEIQSLVRRVARHRPVLVRETIPKKLDLPAVTDLFRTLVADGISLAHLGEVLEILARLPVQPDAKGALVEQVRTGLSAVITERLLGPRDGLKVWMLEPETESMLEASLVKTEGGARLLLSEADTSAMLRVVEETLRSTPGQETEGEAVLVTTPLLRRSLQHLLAPMKAPKVTVIKASELEHDVSVEILGRIEMPGY